MPSLQFPRRCLRYCRSLFLTVAGVLTVYLIVRVHWAHHEAPETTDSRMGENILVPNDYNSTACTYVSEMDKVLVILKNRRYRSS